MSNVTECSVLLRSGEGRSGVSGLGQGWARPVWPYLGSPQLPPLRILAPRGSASLTVAPMGLTHLPLVWALEVRAAINLCRWGRYSGWPGGFLCSSKGLGGVFAGGSLPKVTTQHWLGWRAPLMPWFSERGGEGERRAAGQHQHHCGTC